MQVEQRTPARILVVDDEPDLELLVRQKYRRETRDGEFVLHFARDGVEALEALSREQEVDIVLTDINMPRMDGLTLLGHIADMGRLLKVVIVSAYGDMENIRTAMNRGAFDFVTKPIDFEDLTTTIRKTHDEVLALRRGVDLQAQLTVLERELEIASQIQTSALPTTFPDRDEFRLHARMIPAQEVGGDFYDFFMVDEHRLGIAVGDVSGKGLGAAIFMAMTRSMLRSAGMHGMGPAECIRHVNRILFPESLPSMFVTVACGELDLRSGEFVYCLAGHNPPVTIGPGGARELEGTGGLVVCAVPDFEFSDRTVRLQSGDSLFLYSDGVTEASDGAGGQFGSDRLLSGLGRTRGSSPQAMIEGLLSDVTAFSSGASQNDDITMLALNYVGR
jgi:sigma-B regulation protein RsbU (phosphoserine phosphatase)